MILTGPSLSSNFAHNHNHGHKTWHTHRDRHKQQQVDSSASKQQAAYSSSLRRQPPPPPPPQQPAPQRPHTALMECLANGSSSSGNQKATGGSSTLNRLDQLKRSQQSSNTARSSETSALRRNLSSLGHYPGQINGFARNSNVARRHHYGDSEPIYSPASIASPREFNSIYSTANPERTNQTTLYRNLQEERPRQQQQQQHYAAVSVHNQMSGPARVQADRPESRASTTLTSRPGSSLGQLLERFGSTLKRQARRHLSRRGRSWSASRRCETPASQIYAPISIAGVPSSTTSRVFGQQHLAAASVSSHSTGSPFTRSSSSRQAPDSGYATSTPPPPALPVPQPLPPGRPIVMDADLYAALGKRQVTADEIYAEGLRALDCNAERRLLEHQLLVPELMAEGETCTIIEHQSRQQPDYQLLVKQLINWLNDELAERRIVVRDLQDDLHDGQVLCHLVEKFHCFQGSRGLDLVEVTQNETRQRQKLQVALETINRSLRQAPSWPESGGGGWRQIRWSVEGIHGKNMVQIIQLLVAIVLLHKVPLKLPPNVDVQVLVFQKHHNVLLHRTHRVQLTDSSASIPSQISGLSRAARLAPNADATGSRRDAFDLLLECAPEKLHIVKQSLVRFCNRHLNKINMSCGHGDDLKPENFSDGLLLVFLISSLEDFFVPLGNLFTTVPSRPAANKLDSLQEEPLQFIDGNNNTAIDLTYAAIGRPTALEPASFTCSQPVERLHNVHVALQLMEEAGLSDIKQRVRAEEIVNGDLKAVLRVLYALFGRYKHL